MAELSMRIVSIRETCVIVKNVSVSDQRDLENIIVRNMDKNFEKANFAECVSIGKLNVLKVTGGR